MQSQYNGKLELTVVNGKKVMDTENTNYSYGSLQRVLTYSLAQLELAQTKNALILGLGGGSVIQTLRSVRAFEGEITAVEIDPVIIDIAAREFNIRADEQTSIACADAYDFVKLNKRKYDLIIVDLFIDNTIPEKFLTLKFWNRLLNLLNEGGDIIFNTLCHPETDLTFLIKELEKRTMRYELHRYVENSNKVLIAHLGNLA